MAHEVNPPRSLVNLPPLLWSGEYTPDWRDLRWEDKVKKVNAPPKSLWRER